MFYRINPLTTLIHQHGRNYYRQLMLVNNHKLEVLINFISQDQLTDIHQTSAINLHALGLLCHQPRGSNTQLTNACLHTPQSQLTLKYVTRAQIPKKSSSDKLTNIALPPHKQPTHGESTVPNIGVFEPAKILKDGCASITYHDP